MIYYLIILSFVCLTVPQQSNASFFKQAAAWLFGTHQHHLFKEVRCDATSTIMVENVDGSIMVQGWSLDAVAAEIVVTSNLEHICEDLVTLECSSTTIRLMTNGTVPPEAEVAYSLMVPRMAKLIIKNKSGLITIKQCNGPISAISQEGSINLFETTNSVFAYAAGSLWASIRSLLPMQSYECISQKENITLLAPSDLQAMIQASCKTGAITCDLEITLNPITMKLTYDSWQWAKRNIRGMLGNGGPSISLQAYGVIKIAKN